MKALRPSRLALLICLSLSLTASLTGCEFKDIDKRAFVVAIGFDKGEHARLKVSFRLAVPGGDIKKQVSPSLVLTQEADTAADALVRIRSQTEKELDFSHTKLVLLGEDICRENLQGVTRWLFRRHDIQSVSFLAAAKPDALTLLKLQPKTEQPASSSLFLFFDREGTESPLIHTCFLFDFQRRIGNKGMDPVLPVMRQAGSSHYLVNETALFDKEKLRLILPPPKTLLLNSLLASQAEGHWKISSGQMELTLTGKSRAKHTVRRDAAGNMYAQVNIKLQGIVEEASIPVKSSDYRIYQQLCEEQLASQYEALLRTLQQKRLDPLGFGMSYRALNPGELSGVWKDWLEIYPELEIRVDVHVNIQGMGLIG